MSTSYNLQSSIINNKTFFLIWYNITPSDIPVDEYLINYTNTTYGIPGVISTTSMNHEIILDPYSTYNIYISAIDTNTSTLVISNTITLTTTGPINTTNVNNFSGRPFNQTILLEDLTNVTSLSMASSSTDPVFLNPDSSTPFYQKYRIDPKGQLFGNTICGYLNFRNHIVNL